MEDPTEVYIKKTRGSSTANRRSIKACGCTKEDLREMFKTKKTCEQYFCRMSFRGNSIYRRSLECSKRIDKLLEEPIKVLLKSFICVDHLLSRRRLEANLLTVEDMLEI